MSGKNEPNLPPSGLEIEPERYELAAGPTYRFELDRRDFFKTLGAGVLVFFTLSDAEAYQESGGGRRGGSNRSVPAEIGGWLHIGEDGMVQVFSGKAEVGQNVRTSLTQAAADELRIKAASVRVVLADTDLVPYDAGTFGSRSTPAMVPQIRRAASAARELLIDRAAETWKVDRAALTASDGKVSHAATGRSVSYGELTKGQKLIRTVGTGAVTPAVEWKMAGVSVPKVDGRAFVTGRHKYASDIRRPGMQFGKVLRAPSFGASLVSLDSRAAEALPGVTVVRDGEFVGVTAPDEAAAERALAALKAEWKTSPQPPASELYDYLKKQAGRSTPSHTAGSIEQGMAAADHKLSQAYTVAYIAHTPLEPRAAVAEWSGGRVTVWTGTQRPFGVRSEVAQAFGIPESQVRSIVPDTGSGYGGKHTGEAAVEAARLARAAGKPVKLIWTREEEFTWAYFRPAGVIEARGGVRRDGTVTAWEFHNYNSGGSAIRTLYDVPNQHIEFHSTRSPLRQGSYRALASTANIFARECFMDELAAAAKMDPLEFRRRNLKDPRMLAAFEAAAKGFGWGKTKPAAGHGFGMGGGFEKGGYIATCAEVAVDGASGKVTVIRVVSAFECGAVVNPEHLKNQVEGAVIMGLGGALFEAIEFDNGRILNPGFSKYRVPRFADMPAIETILLDRKDLPSAGAGETPIAGIAPAIGNAIFHATGVRLRALPLAPRGLKS